ncbi:YgaP family membrane protein [Halorussus salinisoli]|uniref:YgaP family membrane protein n=1 Tax=Halorussus salinisoli TaxID=2558242 RepID=UPI0010C1821E
MQKNVGGFDRTVRLVIGPVLLVVVLAWLLGAIALDLWLVVVALLVGAILTVTGLTQKCPANSVLGTNTLGEVGETEDESAGETPR